MSNPRTFTWGTKNKVTELTIKSDDTYFALIALGVMMVISVVAALVGVIINNAPLGIGGTIFAGSIYLLVSLCIKREPK